MMHQLKFDEILTYDNFDAILTSFSIGTPSIKEILVEIPGADGSLDLSEVLSGEPLFAERNFNSEFSMVGNDSSVIEKYTNIRSLVHGRKMELTVPNDPSYKYIGRFSVEEIDTKTRVSKFRISGTLEPYKIKKIETVVNKTLEEKTETIVITNGRKTIIPKIYVSDTTQITVNNVSVSLTVGTHRNSNIIFKRGNNDVLLQSQIGTKITFLFYEGEL